MNDLHAFGRNIFILGDFNLPTAKAYSYFSRIFKASSLSQLIDKPTPTRHNNILDMFITNNTEIVNDLTIWDPHISDHQATKAPIMIPRPVYSHKNIQYRDMKNINYGLLGIDICKIKLPYSSLSLYECIDVFTNSLLKVFDCHARVIEKKVLDRPKKTELSASTMSKKYERDVLYKQYQQLKSDENKLRFDLLNREVKKCVAVDSKNSINNTIHNKGVFSAINTLCKLNTK